MSQKDSTLTIFDTDRRDWAVDRAIRRETNARMRGTRHKCDLTGDPITTKANSILCEWIVAADLGMPGYEPDVSGTADKGWDIELADGTTIDVKGTKYDGPRAWLLLPEHRPVVADWYVLVRHLFPTIAVHAREWGSANIVTGCEIVGGEPGTVYARRPVVTDRLKYPARRAVASELVPWRLIRETLTLMVDKFPTD